MPSSVFAGGSWSRDSQSVVFASGSVEGGHADRHIYEVPAAGGNPELLISPKPSEGQPKNDSVDGSGLFSPHFLPTKDGARVLVFAVGGGALTENRLMLQNLETGQRESLGPGAAPFYSASGHLLYGAEGDVWALPFSLDSLQATGETFPVARNGDGPSVADDGTLVYLDTLSLGQERLVWLNRRNERISDIEQSYSLIAYPALSPDGRRVAFEAVENSNADIWIHDTARTTRVRVSDHPTVDVLPVWSPSGNEVAFSSYRSGNTDIFLRQSDGSGETKVLAGTSQNERVSDWSRDGRYILYSLLDAENKSDLWYLEQKEDGWEAHPFLQTPSNERKPKLSPDGRYVAYGSDRSGRNEIYVRPFPAGDSVSSVSGNRGRNARWSRDGKELFYLEGNTLMAASVSTKPTFSLGSVARLFETASPDYDVELDGQAFILPERVGAAPNPIIQIVENWHAEFRERD
jgi:serine/threonine-protein kinase